MLDRNNTPEIIPKKRDIRNPQFILDQIFLNSPRNNSFRENLSIFFIRSWYIPVIKAIVPPEIPGTISTDPINTPIK